MNKGRISVRTCGPFLLSLLLAGCGERTTPSAEENRQLQNAAEMLDEAPGMLANIDENQLGERPANNVSTDESER